MDSLRRALTITAALVLTGLSGGVSLAAVSPLATQAGGTSTDESRAISTLPDGSSIVTGYFQGTATFGSTTLTSAGSDDVFVAKIDASGTYVWATQAGGTSSDQGYGISTLSDGSAIVTGNFQGTATFGSTTVTSAGGRDVFVAKIDASGTYVWATQAGGTEFDYGYAVSTLSDGSALVTGNFQGTATFGSTSLTSSGSRDVFVAKIDASGTYVWATQAGGTSTARGTAISTLSDGSAIVTGYFTGTATFGSTTLTSAGGRDVFVAKIVSAPGAPTSASATAGDAQATISWSAPSSNGGAAITSYTATASPGGATCTTTSTSCTITGLANGTSYTFTVKATNSAGTSPASSPSAAVSPTAPPAAPALAAPALAAPAAPAPPAASAPTDPCAALAGLPKVTCEANATRDAATAQAKATRDSAREVCARKKSKDTRALCTKSANATYTRDAKRANATRARTISRYRCDQMTGAKKKTCTAKANATYTRTVKIASALRARTIARATCATKAQRTQAACTRTANRRYAKAVKTANTKHAQAIVRAK